MKLMKCKFDFDNGACWEKKTCFVFSETGDWNDVLRWLDFELVDSNNCSISDLKIEEIKPYDGLVI